MIWKRPGELTRTGLISFIPNNNKREFVPVESHQKFPDTRFTLHDLEKSVKAGRNKNE